MIGMNYYYTNCSTCLYHRIIDLNRIYGNCTCVNPFAASYHNYYCYELSSIDQDRFNYKRCPYFANFLVNNEEGD